MLLTLASVVLEVIGDLGPPSPRRGLGVVHAAIPSHRLSGRRRPPASITIVPLGLRRSVSL
ncbi:hypothetical protein HLY00_3753 [Mycolicibacterium hippocampi]|uniref:Uncharacterized protein n=1 Tax=Mycolicibacterium hippocampi TaxID=659824 RepID=A0A850PS91_9MYCO|nr:hypothetical protein [Mycolicibacterium hippocampi]